MKKILILGLGIEGVSAANYFGRDSQITVFDDKPKQAQDPDVFKSLKVKEISFYFGASFPKDLDFDFVVRSPGVRPDHKLVKKLKNSVLITSATKIFFEKCPAKIIGVTGTKGKGTTATIIYEILKDDGRDVYLAGNIGTPMLDILPKLNSRSLVVLELSSFQLIDLEKSPNIAVVLMIASEHLDWHKDTHEYREAKSAIVKYQIADDSAVINQDFEASRSLAAKTKAKVFFVSTKKATSGVFVKDSKVVSLILGQEEIIAARQIRLPGRHNLQNVVAATAVAKILGASNASIRKVLKSFKGLKHRLQLAGELNGVKFYDDSFSTTPETTIAAIEAFKNPKILILGGSSKNSDFKSLAKIIVGDKTIKSLIVIGQEKGTILSAVSYAGPFMGKIIEGAKNMQQVVSCAYKVAKPGDVVLLSPACASFDMFKNYRDRGEQFVKEVQKLK